MADKQESFKEFVAEAEEIVEGLNQNLLVMEATQDKTAVRPDIINAVFRGAHSLKGMSGMVGLKKLSEVSHRLEDMLDNLRMGKLTLSQPVMDTLFKGMEIIRKMIQEVNTGEEEETDISPMLQSIEEVMSGGRAAEESGEIEGISPDVTKVLTEYETHRLKENIRLGLNLFEITARFSLDSFDKDLGALTGQLQGMGEVVTTLPSPGMSADSGIIFNLIFGTSSDQAALQSKISGESLEVKPFGPKPKPSQPKETPPPVPAPEGQAMESIRSITPTLRVDIGKLDSILNLVGELVVNKAVIGQIGKEMLQSRGFTSEGIEIQKASQALDRKVAELQEGLIEIRMTPISQVFARLIRVVRKLSRELGKEIDLQISGEETKMDKSMIEEIADPLMHLIRNSLDHGIEPKAERLKAGKPEIGIIKINASQQGNNVVITVEDDGAGINIDRIREKGIERGLLEQDKEYEQRELINLLFTPGFSTAQEVTEVSGRGVGLDVVAKNISDLSGIVEVDTEPGQGSRFSITLPITLVIIKALIIRVGSETFAVPLNSVSESFIIRQKDIQTIEKREVAQLRGLTLSVVRLGNVFQLPGSGTEDEQYVIVIGLAEKRLGIMVDAIEGQQEIVIKSLGEFFRNTSGIAGAAELGNRKTILVVDVAALIEEYFQTAPSEEKSP